MTSLFPTFGNLLQRAKRLLSTDLSPIWQRFLDVCEADEERYIEVRRKHSKRIEEINAVTYLLFENYSNSYPEINSEKLLELAVSQTGLVLEELENGIK